MSGFRCVGSSCGQGRKIILEVEDGINSKTYGRFRGGGGDAERVREANLWGGGGRGGGTISASSLTVNSFGLPRLTGPAGA